MPVDRSSLAFVAVLFIGATATRAALAEDAYTAALLPITAQDLLEPQKRALDDRIREVAANNGVSLMPADVTASNIGKAKKAGVSCNIESLACQAQMGVMLGTQQVIVARVTSDWAGDRLELRVLDALRGTTLREAAQLLPKDTALRDRVTLGVILSALVPNKAGALVISGDAGALTLDGVALTAEQAKGKIEGLAPGPHDVTLHVEGKPDEHKQITIASGASAEVNFGAPKAVAAPPIEEKSQTGLWLVGGGAAAAVVAGAGAGGLQAALEYSAMERGTRGALQVTGISLLGVTALGVVIAGAGGVLLALDAPPAPATTAAP